MPWVDSAPRTVTRTTFAVFGHCYGSGARFRCRSTVADPLILCALATRGPTPRVQLVIPSVARISIRAEGPNLDHVRPSVRHVIGRARTQKAIKVLGIKISKKYYANLCINLQKLAWLPDGRLRSDGCKKSGLKSF